MIEPEAQVLLAVVYAHEVLDIIEKADGVAAVGIAGVLQDAAAGVRTKQAGEGSWSSPLGARASGHALLVSDRSERIYE